MRSSPLRSSPLFITFAIENNTNPLIVNINEIKTISPFIGNELTSVLQLKDGTKFYIEEPTDKIESRLSRPSGHYLA